MPKNAQAEIVTNGERALATVRFQAFSLDTITKEKMEAALMLAEKFAESGMVPESFRVQGKISAGAVLTAIQLGGEVGLSPMQAVQHTMVVKGRPAFWGQACAALVLASGFCENLKIPTAEEVRKTQKAVVKVKRKGMDESIGTFDWEDARLAGVLGKDAYKTSWPDMFIWRAFHRATKIVFADVLKGMVPAEAMEGTDWPEIRDIPHIERGVTVEVGVPPKPKDEPAPAAQPVKEEPADEAPKEEKPKAEEMKVESEQGGTTETKAHPANPTEPKTSPVTATQLTDRICRIMFNQPSAAIAKEKEKVAKFQAAMKSLTAEKHTSTKLMPQEEIDLMFQKVEAVGIEEHDASGTWVWKDGSRGLNGTQEGGAL